MQIELAPPTTTTTISARRVLVLAPHFDDEVFGCAGLLTQLADRGADIQVLYLTDSSGGQEVTEQQESYGTRRRGEAERGLEILGITRMEALDIPDGSLVSWLDRAAAAIGDAVMDHRPDLILSVSPCEITSDHRAAFAALHGAMTSLRGGTELDAIMSGCRILLYEVNHPAYPDLLVDVSPELDRITAAIEAHASQLELHNYREAALGMRRFRALSLPTEVVAAEGFREIGVADLVTHGPSVLARRLGGVSDPVVATGGGPKLSVVVRTKDRPDLLAEALASIADSSYRRLEVVLVNDGGAEPTVAADFPFPVVQINTGHGLGRAGAANAGVDAATGDYLCFLDDDDLVEPEHFATLAGMVSAADVRVAYTDAAVGVYELDPASGWREVERRLPYSRDFDADLLLVDNYIPFNTLIMDMELVRTAGRFDTDLEFFEDWDFLIRLAFLTPFVHAPRVTAEYRHFRGASHHVLGERPRQRSDFLSQKAAVIARHADRVDPDLVARVVDRLRAEAIAGNEAATAARSEMSRVRAAEAAATDAYHRMNGEVVSLRSERDRLTDEVRRHGAEVARLTEAAGSLQLEAEHLRRRDTELQKASDERQTRIDELHAEIERLHALIEAMESTKAWRLHRAVERLKGRG
jgi:LmbE family N-acetylglucosaminyl deacetylase